MLTPTRVPAYLEGAGLLWRSQIMDGPLTIHVAPGRAHNYLVETEEASGFFIKQRDPEDHRDHLANEATVWACLQATACPGITAHLPRLRRQDLDRGVLIFDLLAETESLHERFQRTGRFSRKLNRQLGAFCGRLHRLDLDAVDPPARLLAEAPWIFNVHEPGLALLEYASSGNVYLVEEIQRRTELGDLLESLRDDWRGTAIIHGDLKWANVLVNISSESSRVRPLTVIDWELGGRGDPLWDVAGILSNYLLAWLSSIPMTGNAPLAVGVPHARYPLAILQPAMRDFWTTYLLTRQLGPNEGAQAVETVARYTAARLIQWAYETGQDRTIPSRLELALLDLSGNLSRRPAEAADHLLGIAPAREPRQ